MLLGPSRSPRCALIRDTWKQNRNHQQNIKKKIKELISEEENTISTCFILLESDDWLEKWLVTCWSRESCRLLQFHRRARNCSKKGCQHIRSIKNDMGHFTFGSLFDLVMWKPGIGTRRWHGLLPASLSPWSPGCACKTSPKKSNPPQATMIVEQSFLSASVSAIAASATAQ